MRCTWAAGICCLALLVVAAGCRSPGNPFWGRTVEPELKPAKRPEVACDPPAEARYDTSIYPKEAFNTPDLFKKKDDNAVMPARGGGPGMNPGMMMNQQGARPGF